MFVNLVSFGVSYSKEKKERPSRFGVSLGMLVRQRVG